MSPVILAKANSPRMATAESQLGALLCIAHSSSMGFCTKTGERSERVQLLFCEFGDQVSEWLSDWIDTFSPQIKYLAQIFQNVQCEVA